MAFSAPHPQSWNFAENFAAEDVTMTYARQMVIKQGHTPLGSGVTNLLRVLAKMADAKAAVEIGSNYGISGLALFSGMHERGILTSIDPEPEQHVIARSLYELQLLSTQRFRLIPGRPLDVLPKLRNGAYDLVFINGDKLEYVEYVEQGIRLLRSSGMMIVNDVLWHDQVADPHNQSDEALIIREALDAVKNDENLVTTLIPVGNGILLAVKK